MPDAHRATCWKSQPHGVKQYLRPKVKQVLDLSLIQTRKASKLVDKDQQKTFDDLAE